MKLTLIIAVTTYILLNYFRPKLDRTSDGKLLLWYGSEYKRKYIILWQN